MSPEKALMHARCKLFHEYSELETLLLNEYQKLTLLMGWVTNRLSVLDQHGLTPEQYSFDQENLNLSEILALLKEEQATLERIRVFKARQKQVTQELYAQEPNLERLKMLPEQGGTCGYTQSRIDMIKKFQIGMLDTISEDYRIVVAKYLDAVGVELKSPIEQNLSVPLMYSENYLRWNKTWQFTEEQTEIQSETLKILPRLEM